MSPKRFSGIHFSYLLLLFSIIIASCAQISAPTGGKKDTTPPIVLKYLPENNSINFKSKEIKISFNEWVQNIQSVNNQVIISPSLQPFPKIEIVRNELTIKFKDTLQPATTYSIFFGDNIKDNNEGNPYSNLKYIFSTGSFIDSLSLSATIKTDLDKIPDNTYLLLYKQLEDSAFITQKPFYISKVSLEGKAQLDNVKEGVYRIYALSDKNGNYFYDLPTEAIAYMDSAIYIKNNMVNLGLELFMPEQEKTRIIEFDRSIKGGIWHITFNKELSFTKDEIKVEVLEEPTVQPIAFQLSTTASAGGSSMCVYFPKLEKDSSDLKLIVKANGILLDTFPVTIESKVFKKPVIYFTDTAAYKNLNIIPNQSLKLKASYYGLTPIDTNKNFITDTANNKISFQVSRDQDLCTYLYSANWKPEMIYKLHLLDSAFFDIAGNPNKQQVFTFLVKSPKKMGSLSVLYTFPKRESSYILILKDNSNKTIQQHTVKDTSQVKIDYGLLSPGTYNIQVIDDVNDNGIRNSGSFFNKTTPEKIYKEPKPVIVKENWDSEENIKVDFSVRSSSSSKAATMPEKTNNSTRESIKTDTPSKKIGVIKK